MDLWTFRGTDASVASTWFGRLRHARLKVVVLQPTVVALGASFSRFGCFVFETTENEDPLEIPLKLVTTSRHWRSVRNITIFPLPFSQTKVEKVREARSPQRRGAKMLRLVGRSEDLAHNSRLAKLERKQLLRRL